MRRRRRRRAAALLLVLALFLLGVGVDELLHAPFLAVQTIRVEGGPAQLAALSGVRRGTPLFAVSTDAVRRRLAKADPWLGSITVEKLFPTTLLLRVSERHVVALVETTDARVLGIDGSGRLLPVAKEAMTLYPFLGGVRVPDWPFHDVLDARIRSELLLVKALPASLETQVAEVDVGKRGDQLLLSSGTRVDLGQPFQLAQKFTVLQAILRQLAAEHRIVPRIELVDPLAPSLISTP